MSCCHRSKGKERTMNEKSGKDKINRVTRKVTAAPAREQKKDV
jgi:hypothetical protein